MIETVGLDHSEANTRANSRDANNDSERVETRKWRQPNYKIGWRLGIGMRNASCGSAVRNSRLRDDAFEPRNVKKLNDGSSNRKTENRPTRTRNYYYRHLALLCAYSGH